MGESCLTGNESSASKRFTHRCILKRVAKLEKAESRGRVRDGARLGERGGGRGAGGTDLENRWWDERKVYLLDIRFSNALF